MVQRVLTMALVGATLLVAWHLAPDGLPQAHAWGRQRTAPDLFYNFYVPPYGGGVGAELYISPRPTPPLVGHTYYTYEPLMPHEFLRGHHRTYIRHHPDGRKTRTLVWWH